MFSVAAYLSRQPKSALYSPLNVRPSLRGYNHDNPDLASGIPIQPDQGVSITGLAIMQCPTGRDLFFDQKKVESVWWPRVLGSLVDKLLVPLFDEGINWLDTKFESVTIFTDQELTDFLYETGINKLDELIRGWVCPWPGVHKGKGIEEIADLCWPGNGDKLLDNTMVAIKELINLEIVSLIDFINDTKKQYGQDWVLFFRENFQLRTEVGLDETKEQRKINLLLGLNNGIRPDFLYSVTLVGDLKTSKDASYYDRVMAGYAIYLEAVLKKRVNTAAVFLVDIDFDNGRLNDRIIRLISVNDDLRVGWRQQRNSALSIVRSKSTPSLPHDKSKCPECKYLHHCWVGGVIGVPNPSAV